MTALFSAPPLPKTGRLLNLKALLGSSSSSSSARTDAGSPSSQQSARRSADPDDEDLEELNAALDTLTEVFPEVQPEVFREMLINVSPQSRIEVITEMLLKDKDKWVQGRFKGAAETAAVKVGRSADGHSKLEELHLAVARKDVFRNSEYRLSVKKAFYQEFKGLSHSTIKAVLAEQNYSYAQSRPVLLQLSSKSWAFYLTSMWVKRRAPLEDLKDHPLIGWRTDTNTAGRVLPFVRTGSSPELDDEVHKLFVAPYLRKIEEERMKADAAVATELNEKEAEDAGAWYECECCYTPQTFEQLSVCSDAGHYLCFRCVRHAVHESLHGQGWARNIDTRRVTVRCLAPTTDECHGHVPAAIARRAVLDDATGDQTWRELETRVALDSMIKSQLPLQKCPFCPYAEVDEAHHMRFKDPLTFSAQLDKEILALCSPLWAELLLVVLYPVAWLLFSFVVGLLSCLYSPLRMELAASQARITRRRRGLRFHCRSPNCGASSCSLCGARWTDPHICNETPYASLRHAVEAATTASVKRTCPKCHLSFVKSSGCNKLVCNCGYAMCYVCRREIGKEGYAHFCQHFRVQRGRCQECDRCDLYVVEDDEVTIRRAAEQAERDWRDKEGKQVVAHMATGHAVGSPGRGGRHHNDKFRSIAEDVISGGRRRGKSCDWEKIMDACLDAVLA